ncbi:MAG: DUF5615 family PIN-like protein [Bacteroidota bacterium]
MKFLIDENIRSEIMYFLIQQGYNVKKVASGMKNSNVIHLAREEKRVLLTHDIHFSNILMYPSKEHSGIIRIRIHPPLLNTIINALSNLLNSLPAEQFNKKLIILEKDGFRIRK